MKNYDSWKLSPPPYYDDLPHCEYDDTEIVPKEDEVCLLHNGTLVKLSNINRYLSKHIIESIGFIDSKGDYRKVAEWEDE